MEHPQEKVVAKLRIAPELHRALRIMAADRHMSMSAVASEIFYLALSQPANPMELDRTTSCSGKISEESINAVLSKYGVK